MYHQVSQHPDHTLWPTMGKAQHLYNQTHGVEMAARKPKTQVYTTSASSAISRHKPNTISTLRTCPDAYFPCNFGISKRPTSVNLRKFVKIEKRERFWVTLWIEIQLYET